MITNVGPVHVELLGSSEAIAATKAELLAGLGDGGAAVVPAEAGALAPHLGEAEPRRPGTGCCASAPAATSAASEIAAAGGETERRRRDAAGRAARFELPFVEAHNLDNALAAIAVGVALELPLDGDGRASAAG